MYVYMYVCQFAWFVEGFLQNPATALPVSVASKASWDEEEAWAQADLDRKSVV